MFKHKNKFFSFPETLFIYFKIFYWGRALASAQGRSCVLSLWLMRYPRAHQVDRRASQQQAHLKDGLTVVPLSSAHSASTHGIPEPTEGAPGICYSNRPGRTGREEWCEHVGGLSRPEPSTLTLLSLTAFIFIMKRGLVSYVAPRCVIPYVVLFCFVNCIIFKYLSFKKRKKYKKNLVKALRRD